jgi:hypothetical protein
MCSFFALHSQPFSQRLRPQPQKKHEETLASSFAGTKNTGCVSIKKASQRGFEKESCTTGCTAGCTVLACGFFFLFFSGLWIARKSMENIALRTGWRGQTGCAAGCISSCPARRAASSYAKLDVPEPQAP